MKLKNNPRTKIQAHKELKYFEKFAIYILFLLKNFEAGHYNFVIFLQIAMRFNTEYS